MLILHSLTILFMEQTIISTLNNRSLIWNKLSALEFNIHFSLNSKLLLDNITYLDYNIFI